MEATLNISFKTVKELIRTVDLPYYCKSKYDRYYKVLNATEVVIYTEKSISYNNPNVIDFSELIEISESEFEAFASETEKFILSKLNKTI